jgi:hypothetical protein|tara:strand:- start:37 stop:222 length:186 start_codon:yes stop_codon:yes gene_type:complete
MKMTKKKYWNRPSSQRLYEQLQSDVDNINHANDLREKSRTDAQKKYRDLMQSKNLKEKLND